MKFFVDEVNIGPLRLHSVYYADMTKARAGETNFAVGTGNAIRFKSTIQKIWSCSVKISEDPKLSQRKDFEIFE